MTPTHNTVTGYELWILNGDAEGKVDMETELQLAANVSAFSVPENTWSRMGVGQVKLGPLKGTATVSVASSCDKKFSISALKATTPLGRLFMKAPRCLVFPGPLT